MKNIHFDFSKIFLILIFFFGFLKGLVSNAQVNPDIEKRQFSGNGAKNFLGKNTVLIFTNPKCKVYR